jgi:hypothetical protein
MVDRFHSEEMPMIPDNYNAEWGPKENAEMTKEEYIAQYLSWVCRTTIHNWNKQQRVSEGDYRYCCPSIAHSTKYSHCFSWYRLSHHEHKSTSTATFMTSFEVIALTDLSTVCIIYQELILLKAVPGEYLLGKESRSSRRRPNHAWPFWSISCCNNGDEEMYEVPCWWYWRLRTLPELIGAPKGGFQPRSQKELLQVIEWGQRLSCNSRAALRSKYRQWWTGSRLHLRRHFDLVDLLCTTYAPLCIHKHRPIGSNDFYPLQIYYEGCMQLLAQRYKFGLSNPQIADHKPMCCVNTSIMPRK